MQKLDIKKIIGPLLALLLVLPGWTQVNNVNQSLAKVKQECERVNRLAGERQVVQAMELLNGSRRSFDNYVTYYLEDEMRRAKAEDASFRPVLNVQFSPVLTARYWEDKVEKAQNQIKLAKEAYADRHYARTLDYQDKVWAYMKTVYNIANSIKDVYENVQTMELYDALKSAKEGVDDFIENYKEIENAHLQEINTELNEMQTQSIIRRAEIMEEKCWQLASFMRAYEQDVNDFYQLIGRFNQTVDRVSREETVNWNSPGYRWDKQAWLNKANAEANRFKQGSFDYRALESKIEAIISDAEEDKNRVYQNIANSGANDAFERGNRLEDEFNDFYELAFDVIDECYVLSQKEVQQPDINSELSTAGTEKYSYILNPDAKIQSVSKYGNQYREGNLSEVEYQQKYEAIINGLNNDKQLFLGASRSEEERNEIEKQYNDFTSLVYVKWSGYLNTQTQNRPVVAANANSNTTTVSSTGQQAIGVATPAQQTAADHQAPVSTARGTSPPGSRVKNTLFHNYWAHGQQTIKFTQHGNTSEVGHVGKGTVSSNTLTVTYTDNKGVQRTNTYTLVGDGYEMNAKIEWTDDALHQKLLIENNFTAPKKEEMEAYRMKNGNYQNVVYSYYGTNMAMFESDSDGDQVADECDKCPGTPRGLTVSNGGVDIAGCPTGQGQVMSTTSTGKPGESSSSGQNNRAPGNATTSSSNPFAGAATQTSSAQPKNTYTAPSISASASPLPTQPNTPPPGYVGTIENTGNGKGTYCSYPVGKIKSSDRLIFHVLSGELKRVEVIWRTSSGVWRTQYEGTQTVFTAGDFLKDIPPNITHLNFTVNATHNRSFLPDACRAEVWCLPPGAKVPTNWRKENTGDELSKEFEELISKADEAFNRKYWNESRGPTASSNPKQESLDYLRRCEPLIARQQDMGQRYRMVKRLNSKYAEYARRVFANTAKTGFINQAGSLLNNYGNRANSINDPKLKARAYQVIAESWRELTKAAFWGSHQYNKMACDTEAKKYYELALNEDRSNAQLQKTVEKINAPKKPVPAPVARTKPIPEEKWAKAESFRNAVVETNIGERIFDFGPTNYAEIGNLTMLNVGSGDVWIMRAGSSEWRAVTENTAVFAGDKIKTGENAQNVSFTYSADKAFLNIKPNAIIEFQEDQLYISRGHAHIRVVKKGSEFLVITPTAVTGPRGTEFTVNVDPAGKTDVHLYEGAIEMRNSTEISYLVPGQTAHVSTDDRPIETRPFNIQQHKQQHWKNLPVAGHAADPGVDPFKNVSGGGRIVGGR